MKRIKRFLMGTVLAAAGFAAMPFYILCANIRPAIRYALERSGCNYSQ